jgi:3-oxoacyl-[acyl-carrier-protein] synthase II
MVARRVVVTGIGLVTPFGMGAARLWDGLLAGASAVGPVTAFDASACATGFAGEIRPDGFDAGQLVADRRQRAAMGRHAQLAVAAAMLAMRDAGLGSTRLDPARVGVFVGTNHDRTAFLDMYGLLTRLRDPEDPTRPDVTRFWELARRHYDPMRFIRTVPNGPAAHVAIGAQARGPNSTVLTDGVASTLAIGDAARVVERGEADVMLAGGADSEVTPDAFLWWELLGLLSRSRECAATASRPFDAARDGLVPGEGAGMLVLEPLPHARARGARVYGELTGYGAAMDAGLVPAETSGGDAIARAITAALADARRPPPSVGYLNAHGLAAPLLDRVEARGIRRAFPARTPPVSSIKGAVGYSNAAAGVLDLACCLLALQAGVLPATVNLEAPDPACDLDHIVGEPRRAAIDCALSVSFGLGGQAAALLVGRDAA